MSYIKIILSLYPILIDNPANLFIDLDGYFLGRTASQGDSGEQRCVPIYTVKPVFNMFKGHSDQSVERTAYD